MLLAGTADGIFILDDGGATQTLDARHIRDLVAIDDRIFAGTATGVFVSDDAGCTWAEAGLTGTEIWQIRSDGHGLIYAGTQPAGLFHTADHGATWVEIESFAALPEASNWCVPLDPPLPPRARALVIDQQDPNRIWVGVEVGGIARSTDAGATWTVDLPGNNPDLHMLFAQPDQPQTLFASTGYGRFDGIAEEVEGNAGVFRSDDGGESWQYAWNGITPRYSRPMCIDHRAPHSLTVASAPTAFSHYKHDGGANAALFRSDDHGQSWRSLCDDAHSPSRANFHGLTVDPKRHGGVVVGTDTGEVWRVSSDCEWEEIGSGLPLVWSLLAAETQTGTEPEPEPESQLETKGAA